MKQKGTINISTLIIAFAIFSLITGLGISMVKEVRDVVPSSFNESDLNDFNDTFNKIDDFEEQGESLETRLTSDERNDFGVFGALNDLIKTAWFTIKNTFSSFDFISTMITGISSRFGVPSFVPAILVTIIIFIIGYNIIGLIFNRTA